jgi:mRNA interferase ChpB
VSRAKIYRQGDILAISLDPTLGTEIRGMRPVLVLSNAEFNRNGRALVAPITQGGNWGRVAGWAVPLIGTGTATQGVAVVSQCRVLDLAVRGARKIEAVPPDIIEEALAKLQAMIDPC